MLGRLIANPKVQSDRPDEPLQGIYGPATWADNWIEKGLAALEKANA